MSIRFRRGSRRQAYRPGIARLRLMLEPLEDRTLLSVINWVNTAGGDWGTASNWDLNRIPIATDDVVINLAGITVSHTSGSDTIRSLTSTDVLNLSGGSLTI